MLINNIFKISPLFILLCFCSIVFSQSITNTGEQTNTSSSFVNQNGEVSSSGVLNKNGKLLSLAALTTNSVSDITGITATCGGNITENGGAEIFERGVCWSTSSNPTIADYFTIEGIGLGSFTCNLTGLSLGTIYYVRAYAKNSVGVSYGNQQMFTTLDIPTLTTDNPSNVAPVSATCGGNITDDGGSSVTERGVCWSTASNPTIADIKTIDGSGSGVFVSNIIQLLENTTYYVRAYATNNIGTAYGNQKSFTTSEFPGCGYVMDINGNVYATVQIGTQCWLKENLKATHYPDGTPIPYITDGITWGNLLANNTDDAFCYYNNNTSSPYGALYSWAAAMGDNAVSSSSNPSGVQGVCPDGWHLPSSAEWQQLKDYVGSNGYSGNEGHALKSISGWFDDNNGINTFGFNGVHSGIRFGGTLYQGMFVWGFNIAKWWASDEIISDEAYTGNVNTGLELKIDAGLGRKNDAGSVRCIKN